MSSKPCKIGYILPNMSVHSTILSHTDMVCFVKNTLDLLKDKIYNFRKKRLNCHRADALKIMFCIRVPGDNLDFCQPLFVFAS